MQARRKAETGLGPAEVELAAEISHELGNHFHKLRFWTVQLRDEVAAGDPGTETTALLERGLEQLESFVRMAVEYYAPPRLSLSRVSVSDLVESLRAGPAAGGLIVRGLEQCRDGELEVDPNVVRRGFGILCGQVKATLVEGEELYLAVNSSERAEPGGVELEFRLGRGHNGAVRLDGGVEMALVKRCVELHGGELFERAGDAASVVVFLPLCV